MINGWKVTGLKRNIGQSWKTEEIHFSYAKKQWIAFQKQSNYAIVPR